MCCVCRRGNRTLTVCSPRRGLMGRGGQELAQQGCHHVPVLFQKHAFACVVSLRAGEQRVNGEMLVKCTGFSVSTAKFLGHVGIVFVTLGEFYVDFSKPSDHDKVGFLSQRRDFLFSDTFFSL